MKKTKGFTLIELMIAVAIVGVLTAIAYPSYQNYLVKGTRANAKAFLMDVASKEQQYLMDSRAYTATLSDLGLTAPKEFSPYYTLTITVTAGPPPTFIVTATPKPGTRQKNDGALVINQKGDKTPADKW